MFSFGEVGQWETDSIHGGQQKMLLQKKQDVTNFLWSMNVCFTTYSQCLYFSKACITVNNSWFPTS